MSFLFADVIVPLALHGVLTYRLPVSLAGKVGVGFRVIVSVGKRKQYTGIVLRLHGEAPARDFALKEVADVVDTAPLLLPQQLEFWQWLSEYYMCTLGEVMKAALPSGLKLESETLVSRNADFDGEERLKGNEIRILDALDAPMTVDKLSSLLGMASVLPVVQRLVETGAVEISETLSRTFRPRTETHVRLTAEWAEEEKLNAFLATLSRTPKQEKILLTYLDLSAAPTALSLRNPQLLLEVSKKQLLLEAGGSEAALSALRKKGILETYPFAVERRKKRLSPLAVVQPSLSEAQQSAAAQITACFSERSAQDATQPRVCLLHGVTSSGKTEVYTRLIQQTIAEGKQALFLVPEIALTTQLTARLERIFGEKMGVYHSKFPDAERVELWQRQLSAEAFPLIVGVRSSLFLPFRNLGLIIVDEEHETSYKQQDPAPRYHARDAALMLARQLGADTLLGTATPAIETYRNALSGRYGLVELTTRFGEVEQPEIIVEDLRELSRKRLLTSPFSPRLTEEIRRTLERKEQVILFQNRRGYSPVIECRTCGWTPKCRSCDVPLTYHHAARNLVCHYCGTTYAVPAQCPNCHGTDLRDIGYGTEKIEEAVHAAFPTARTARMDLDTTGSRTAYEKILHAFEQGETDILIGTQMVTKGLDFERVRLVGILYADQMLNQPDFRAYERAYQMLSQVAGRAGRRGKQGLVILQTKQADNPLITQVRIGDYGGMYAGQFRERQAFHYPPFVRLIAIYFRHREERVAEQAAHAYHRLIAPSFSGMLLGPDRPAVGRVKSLYIRKLLLKVSPSLSPSSVRQVLLHARDTLFADASSRNVSVYFDVDPM